MLPLQLLLLPILLPLLLALLLLALSPTVALMIVSSLF